MNTRSAAASSEHHHLHVNASTHATDATRAMRAPYAARAIFSFLRRIEGGTLTVEGPHGFHQTFGHAGSGRAVRITLADWDVLQRCLKSGDIGFAETWMEGRWQCDDVPGLIELFCRNRSAMEGAIYGSWLGNLAYRIRHWLNANTRKRAKKNIEAHYDLGNQFYRLWLDASMTYSSALFEGDATLSLQDAQLAKYRRILRALGVKPGDRILEIGCGWGGFAETAIRECGAHVTGLTLSTEQLEWARARLDAAGLGTQAQLLLVDYRDFEDKVHGGFDHIVSIEMFEAVGEQFWDAYFAAVKRNLKPGGRALVQSITIDEALFARYRVGTDFIQQYIFPGGMLPSPTEFLARAAAAGLTSAGSLRFGRDYAETLKRWRAAFMGVLPQVREQGFDQRFVRLWEFYLAYCEGAFNAGSTDVVQFELRHAQ